MTADRKTPEDQEVPLPGDEVPVPPHPDLRPAGGQDVDELPNRDEVSPDLPS